jgi:hypothetical protein
MALSRFAGENFLTHPLPDYEKEWRTIVFKGIFATVVFIFVLPTLVQRWFSSTSESSTKSCQEESFARSNESRPKHKVRVVTKTIINGKDRGSTISSKGSGSRSIQKNRNKLSNHDDASKTDKQNTMNKQKKEAKVPTFIFPFMNSVYLAYLIFLILQSPNNKDTARRVYVAPLLRKHETDMIVQMATNAAERNAHRAKVELDRLSKDENASDKIKRFEKILEWPSGFLKDRYVAIVHFC